MDENKFFKELHDVDEEQQVLDKIEYLRHTFDEVKLTFNKDKYEKTTHLINQIVEKMKNNQGVKNAVIKYVNRYVPYDKDKAIEELYQLLAGEILGTMMALSHATCSIQ